ncbi:MAG: 2-oxoglutarate oxidoreductase [Brockia lithotrophica]|nr:2-oxoglutarate oxidoreductase [Brockia lithotrophica]
MSRDVRESRGAATEEAAGVQAGSPTGSLVREREEGAGRSKVVFARSRGLTEARTIYCPGCTHGIIHRLVAEVLEELDLLGRTVGVGSIGCSVLIYDYLDVDMISAAHGRALAVATGVKRVLPDRFVFTYQGDGDLASIGTAETVHAAARGERVTAILVNNGVYGMTGGQMAPTTLPGMRTTTSPAGRDPALTGFPIRMPEMLASLEGAVYLARVTVTSPKEVLRAKRVLKRAFEVQLQGLGFSLVEFLSSCPINWKMNPADALRYIEKEVVKYYPPGEIKVPEGWKPLA